MRRIAGYAVVAGATALGTAMGLVLGVDRVIARRAAEAALTEAEDESLYQESSHGPVALWGPLPVPVPDPEFQASLLHCVQLPTSEEVLFEDVRAMFEHFRDHFQRDPQPGEIRTAFGLKHARAVELHRRFTNELGDWNEGR
jgi:hypothetical protein